MRSIGIALVLFCSCIAAMACGVDVVGGGGPQGETIKLSSCGGFTAHPQECPAGYYCVDRAPNCRQAVDCPGVCVDDPSAPFCGGPEGLVCPDGLVCADNTLDSCDPQDGGVDCGGICVRP